MLESAVRKEISDRLKGGGPVAIYTHVNPDGDAVGSSVALGLVLRKMGLDVAVLIPNGLPDFLKWLPGSDMITVFREQPDRARDLTRNAKTMFFLDFNESDRLDVLKENVMDAGAFKIMIDHHEHPHQLADITVSRPGRSSVGEMIYEFIQDMGLRDHMDHDIATALYVAIMTDTGNFRHSSSYPEVFRVAGDLMNFDIDKDEIFTRIYDSFSLSRMRLLGYCMLEKMVYLEEYATAYISITREELKEYNYQVGDTEGFVNIPFSVKGVKFTALFIEKENYVKASFRSKGAFSVDQFALKHFNGGGHLNAAGGESDASMDETLNRFESLVAEYKDEII